MGSTSRIVGEFSVRARDDERPAFSPDGRGMYLFTEDSEQGPAYFNLPRGERGTGIATADGRPTPHCDCDAGYTRAVCGDSSGFAVLDLRSGMWLGRLARAAHSVYEHGCLSPDGRYFAAQGAHQAREQLNPAPELVIGDGISMLNKSDVWVYTYEPEIVVYDLSRLATQAP